MGRLAHAFHELLADLREKRDMEEYVRRALAQPARSRRRCAACSARRRAGRRCCSAVELRQYARAGGAGDARETLARLAADLDRVTSAVARGRG